MRKRRMLPQLVLLLLVLLLLVLSLRQGVAHSSRRGRRGSG